MYLNLYHNIIINKNLLKVVGMPAALYWAELQDILQHVFEKKTFNEQGFFPLDRGYVERDIGLSLKEQYACDAQLIQLGVLVKDENNPDSIAVDVARMVAVISNSDPAELKALAKAAKPTRTGRKKATEEETAAKTAAKIKMFKSKIVEPVAEIREALERWVEMVLESKYAYTLTNQSLISTQNALQRYSTDPQTTVAVIEISILKGWSDITWAINEHRKQAAASAAKSGTTVISPRNESTKVGQITF